MINEVINQLEEELESFLALWASFLQKAGYFEFACARRDDAIKAFNALLSDLKKQAGADLTVSLTEPREGSGRASFFLKAAKEQRTCGETAQMCLTFFKGMRIAVEAIIEEMILPDREKLNALRELRHYCDSIETAIVADLERIDKNHVIASLEKTNRRLAREKNTYESIFESTSNLVLITDDDGLIQEANPEAKIFFSGRHFIGQYCGQLLGLPGETLSDLKDQVPLNQAHEICLEVGGYSRVFNLQLKPLDRISLSTRGIMLILSDITCIVDHRQTLEQRVEDRTRELANSEKMLKTIFQSVGKGILLIDRDREIVKANQHASEIYGIPLEVLIGTNFCDLMTPQDCEKVNRICDTLLEGQRKNVEVTSLYVNGETFPSDIIMTCMDMNGQHFWPVIVRDISEQRALEDGLRAEKLQSEEMNVTLRNVLKSIEHDRREAEHNLSHRIRSSMIPGIEKIRRESHFETRSSYLNMLKDQLVSLTAGLESELDGDLLKLSKTELKICRFIKAGMSGKEICDALNLSFETIQTHRKNIRKKLGLSGKNVNLHTFLTNRNVDLGGIGGD